MTGGIDLATTPAPAALDRWDPSTGIDPDLRRLTEERIVEYRAVDDTYRWNPDGVGP